MMEREAHINVLELLGGTFAVKVLAGNMRDVHIKLWMDNCSAVSYINHMGGTRSQNLTWYTKELWSWCLQRGIVPGFFLGGGGGGEAFAPPPPLLDVCPP